MRRFVSACAIVAVGLALACSQDASVHAQNGQWGTVKGRIIWGGKDIPKPQKLNLAGKNDEKFCGDVYSEEWVVNAKNKGLKWTFVWLINNDPKDKTPLPIHPKLKEVTPKEVIIDQPVCTFIPHAVAVREGQVVIAKNSAKVQHNFKWTGNPFNENAGNNILIPPGGALALKPNLVADRLPVKVECGIHPWMNGWIRVFNHPYYAVTDESGGFEFKDAPAGQYRLVVWHGSGGWRGGAKGKDGMPITIKAGGVTDVGDLDYPPPAAN